MEIKKITEKIYKIMNPADLGEYRSIPFWSWNDKLEPQELIEQIKWMKKQGFGGYFMHARGGLMTEYLGEEWFECIKACIEEGEKLGMDSWAYDENGWPSGFAGGKLLDDDNNKDMYLTYETGEFDSNAMVSYLITENKLIRTDEGGKGEYLNIYAHLSVSTADILNRDVVDKFISLTHERYKKECGENFNTGLKGFFTDEPQYYRHGQPYTRVLPSYFEKKYGDDILDGLGLLFMEKDGYRTFRYRYWLSLQNLMLESFSKTVYEWCDKNKIMLTGHYIEEATLSYQMCCCGGIMPFYEYEHIPGIDKLGRNIASPVSPKQVSSVARQLGKKRVLTETYACCGWDVTPRELKKLADWQYVNGVNLMCQHLLPYSEHGQRKRDYPAHFSWANPWVKHDFKTFNDYYAKLGYLLGESEEIVSVAMFCPVRSMYLTYKREKFQGGEFGLGKSYIELSRKLSAMNLPYHIIDETIMEKHARVEGDKLIVGNCTYDAVIFPETYTMGKFTAMLMEKFYANGGKILFTCGKPSYIEGEPHEYKLESNVKIEEIVSAQPYRVSRFDSGVQSTLRRIGDLSFIFAANVGDKTETLSFLGDFNGFAAFDPETSSCRKADTTLTFEPGDSYVLFITDECKTTSDEILKTAGENGRYIFGETEMKNVSERKRLSLDGNFKVLSDTGNYLTVDRLSYSKDGINYSQKIGYMGVLDTLLNERYEGDLYLKYTFNARYIPDNLKLLSEDMNNVWCTVNGKKIEFNGASDFEKKIYTADISKHAIIGENEIIIKIRFFESEKVYYALFGENVTESLKNCLVYDTTVEACYIQGDFGVYSENGFYDGKEPNVIMSDGEFYIDRKKKEVGETVGDGYPFFAGSITLEKEFYSDGKPTVLDLKGRFHLCDISINGKKAEKSYFADKVDITEYITEGNNVAKITLYSGNRNLLGPHHMKDYEEPKGVGPYSFELPGTWENGKSNKERDSYSFVKFGLF